MKPSYSRACKLLTPKERRSIAGQKIDVVVPSVPMPKAFQCRWLTSTTSSFPTVQVVTMTAQSWVSQASPRIDEALFRRSTGKKLTARLLEARKTIARGADELSDREACDVFSTLNEANSGDKGVRTASSLGTVQGQPSATVSMCSKGAVTSLAYAEVGLQPGAAVFQAVSRLLKIAHQRAVKQFQ